MKKKTRIILAVLGVLVVCLGIFWNDLLLARMNSQMNALIKEDSSIELLETRSVCGKLNGNGNGMQFYCAALVRSDSEENVKLLAESLSETFEIAGYCLQASPKIQSTYLQHTTMTFQQSISYEDGDYYTIYIYCSKHNLANPLDVRGH